MLVVGLLVACSWASTVGVLAEEPAAAELGPDPFLGILLEDLNFLRVESGIIPLDADPRLDEVAQDIADRITIAGSIAAAKPSAKDVSEALESRSYRAVRLVLAYAESESSPELLLDEWHAAAPDIFDQLRSPDLRHLGIGVGDARGVPVYVMVASVSAIRHLGEQADALGNLRSIRRQALDWVNEQRRRAGLHAYYAASELDRVAQAYAEEMVRRGFYGHESPEGLTVLDRVRASEYQATRVGENIASGQPTLEMVLDGWLASPDHRANLLHSRFRQMGLGVAHAPAEDGTYQIRWVQVFASRR